MSDKTSNSSNDPIPYIRNGSLSERLSALMRGRSVRQAASDWGIGTSTLNAYLRNGTVPSLNLANQISNREGVTLQWLATGEGRIVEGEVNERSQQVTYALLTNDEETLAKLETVSEQNVRDNLRLYHELKEKIKLPDFTKDIIATALTGARVGPFDADTISKILGELNNEFGNEFALIPCYPVQVSAGNGSFVDNEQPIKHLAFRRRWLKWRGFDEHDLAIVWASGDSMESTISHKDTLVVHLRRKTPRDGNIYVIRNGDQVWVKYVQVKPYSWLLISENKLYPPIEIPMTEQHQFEIVGEVVHIAKDVGE